MEFRNFGFLKSSHQSIRDFSFIFLNLNYFHIPVIFNKNTIHWLLKIEIKHESIKPKKNWLSFKLFGVI